MLTCSFTNPENSASRTQRRPARRSHTRFRSRDRPTCSTCWHWLLGLAGNDSCKTDAQQEHVVQIIVSINGQRLECAGMRLRRFLQHAVHFGHRRTRHLREEPGVDRHLKVGARIRQRHQFGVSPCSCENLREGTLEVGDCRPCA